MAWWPKMAHTINMINWYVGIGPKQYWSSGLVRYLFYIKASLHEVWITTSDICDIFPDKIFYSAPINRPELINPLGIQIIGSLWAWIPDVILFESKTISLTFKLEGSLGIPRPAPSALKFFGLGDSQWTPYLKSKTNSHTFK